MYRPHRPQRRREKEMGGQRERGTEGRTAGKTERQGPQRDFVSPSLCHSASPSLRLLRILLPIALIATTACLLKASRPNLPAIFPAPIVAKQTGKPPIIIIPGITGSELVNRTTGENLWLELFPADKVALALPIKSTTLSENRGDVYELMVLCADKLIIYI